MVSQGDYNWTMNNPEIWEDMPATEETMMPFANSLDPNETPCITASHCDPSCLKFQNNGKIEYFLTLGKIRRSPEKSELTFHILIDTKTLHDLGLHDPGRRLKHLKGENCVAIPVKWTTGVMALSDILKDKTCHFAEGASFEIKRMNLPIAKHLCIQKPQDILCENLKKFVEEKGYQWSLELAAEVPSHWEVRGDLTLIPSAAFTSQLWSSLGEDLWDVVASSLSCSRLARQGSVLTDGFRSPQVTLLRGDSGWVEQMDNGIRYSYDITKCMFSAGNITEKLRVATFDCTDEIVVDLYAGIGYFTLPYLVHAGVKHLHACEWNPDAVEALRRNVEMNHVQHRCTIHAGDNRQVCPIGIADRVNLGLIPSSRDGWSPACAALRPDRGGTLHIHYNVNTKHPAGFRSNSTTNSEPMEQFRREAKCSRNTPDKTCVQLYTIDSNHAHENGDMSTQLDFSVFERTADSAVLTKAAQSYCQQSTCAFANSQVKEKTRNINVDKNLQAGKGFDESSFWNTEHFCNTENKARNDTHALNAVITNPAYLNCAHEKTVVINKVCTSENQASFSEIKKNTKTNDFLPSSIHIQNGTDKNNVQTPSEYTYTSCEASNIVQNGSRDQNAISKQRKTANGYSKGFHPKWLPWAQEVAMEIKCLLENIHGSGWKTKVLHIEHVKSYAPYVDHVVLDLRCIPE